MRRYKADVRTALPKLPAAKYGVIYADPPWDWMQGGHGKRDFTSKVTGKTNKSFVGATPYVRMSVKELLALAPEVRRVAKPDSHLYLWTINKTVPDAVRIIEAWGYRWVSMVTWDKMRPGIAKYFQGVTEHCVFAVRGRPPYKFVDGKMQQGRTLLAERMTDHSRKPAGMVAMIEKVSAGPYLELFARRAPKGWDAVGLELKQ